MSDIKIPGLDLSSADSVKKGLHDIVESQRALAARGDAMTSNLEKKVEDMKVLRQRLGELENSKTTSAPHMEGEASLQKYVRRDGSLRMKGESTTDRAWTEGLLSDAPVCEWQADLQRAVEQYSIVNTVSKGGAPKSLQAVQDIVSRAPKTVDKIFADYTAIGGEFVPDVMLPELERTLVMERRVAGLFQDMNMNNKTEILPFLTSGLRPHKRGAVTGDSPTAYALSSLATAQRTITAAGLTVNTQVDSDANEDSIINALPLIQAELIASLIDGEEDCIINGSADGAGVDTLSSWNVRSRWGSADASTGDHRLSWVGLRERAIDVSNSTDQSASQTVAGFMTARAKLASPHGVAGDLVCVVSPEYYMTKMLLFGEGSASTAGVIDVSRYGPAATILTGELGQLMGVPIVISEFMSADLAADGGYDGVTTDYTGMLLFNKSRFKMGRLRGATTEIDKDIVSGYHRLVCTSRQVFFTTDAAATKNVHYSFKLDKA
mgnify:CR=1 FL=1